MTAPNVITSTSQIIQKHHGPNTSFIQQQQLAKQASVVGGKTIVCICNFSEGEALRNKVQVKMV